jgi:hypothetical protein
VREKAKVFFVGATMFYYWVDYLLLITLDCRFSSKKLIHQEANAIQDQVAFLEYRLLTSWMDM